ncbi:MAG: DNA-binding protein [Janthinobacterium lividum]
MPSPIPDSPDARLTRAQVADALTAAGYPIRPGTLSTKANRGGGPPFHSWGRRVLYRWADALAWAEGRMTEARRNTSEVDPRHAA